MNTPTKVVSFQIIHFTDQHPETGEPRQILLLYALGEDGTMYEMAGGKWLALPITEETLKKKE